VSPSAKSSALVESSPATATLAQAGAHAAEESARLDAAIAELGVGARAWSHLTLDQRARLLERLHATTAANAQEWAQTAALSKGVGPAHPLRGEEWLSGPYAILVALTAYRRSVEALARGASPLDGLRMDAAPGGRLRAHAFPLTGMDGLLLSGYSGEVWFEPGVTEMHARASAGLGQRHRSRSGGVGLVLGAGNVTSIPVLDVLYELLAHNRVVILKVNPTQNGLVPVYERALAPLIEAGFLRIFRGGGDIGAYLTAHPGVDHVHITGAAPTFDAIVWGTGAAATRRRREGRPQLKKPITAELGGVSPVIVVPGEWTDADLRYQAEHIVTMRLQNGGHNCIAGQVVLLSKDWPQRAAFLAELRRAFTAAPARAVWYPRSDEKLEAAASSYPGAMRVGDGSRLLVEIGPDEDPTDLETTEYFAPVLGVVDIPGNGQEFLDAAVAYANDRLTGTLGANVLIDPASQSALGEGFENAIADLRYGAISINSWTGFAFLTPTLTWGGFPGGTLEDVVSGIGVVHNALLLDGVERSVTRGPFRPFPRSIPRIIRTRSLAKGSVLPKPPWFVDARTGASVSEGFTRYRMDGNLARLAGTLVQAFRA
jgi:acyl-CoA reductase-like NAD-dependent aldehyde dehydrogenase